MKFREFIDRLIVEKLGGNTEGFAHLFEDGALFDEMKSLEGDGEHYFREETYDGWHLIRVPGGYLVYWQERGGRWVDGTFATLGEAMRVFGYAGAVTRPHAAQEAAVPDDSPPRVALRWKSWLACTMAIAMLWLFPKPFAWMVGEPPGIIQFGAILLGIVALLWLNVALFVGEARELVARYKARRGASDGR